MASALSALANASATLNVASSGVVTDPATGNVSPVTTIASLSLFLKAERLDYSPYPGVDVTDTIYDGYVVNPVTLPEGIVIGTRGTLAFGANPSVDCEVLELQLPYGNTGVIGATLSNVLGPRIKLVARGQR